MEQLQNGYTLELAQGSFPLSTDSVALAGFVRLPKNANVLDLCAGCGTLGLMLCAKDASCRVTGIEIEENDHRAAIQNSCRNGLGQRLLSLHADVKDTAQLVAPGSFGVCVSNPPYYSGGPKSAAVPTARRDDLCPPEQLFRAASHALKFGGDFYIVQKPEMLGHLCALGGENGLQVKELMLLRHRENGPVSLVLLKFRKGARPGLVLTEQSLYSADGTPTDYYRSIYHTGE